MLLIAIIYLGNVIALAMLRARKESDIPMPTLEARERRAPKILLAPSLMAVGLLLIVPLGFIVVYSFWLRSASGADQAGFHLDNWQAALTDPFYRYILLNTLKIAAITTVVCAFAGYPAAYFVARSTTATRCSCCCC